MVNEGVLEFALFLNEVASKTTRETAADIRATIVVSDKPTPNQSAGRGPRICFVVIFVRAQSMFRN